MNISNKRLLIIGRLIGVHRKEMLYLTKSARWTQVEFCKDICSEATLSKIESGEEIRFTDNYFVFARKLDFECGEYPKIDLALEKLIDRMYRDMEYGYKDKVILSCKKAVKLLSNVQNVLYYGDLYEIFHGMMRYGDTDTPFPDTFIRRALKEEDILPKKVVDLLKVSIFTNSYLHDSDKAFEKMCKKINLLESDYIVNQMNLLLYYMINSYGIKFISLSNELEKKCIESENYIRLFDMYNICLVMMSELDIEEIPNYVNKIEELVHKNVLPKAKISEYYHNRGLSFYMNHEFENALECLNLASNYDEDDSLSTILFIAGCQRRLNLPVNIKDVSIDKQKKYSKFLQSIYKYFKVCINTTAIERQKFIMNNIVPDLENNEPLFNDMFRYELNELVAETSQYKDTYIFDLKSREVLKIK